MRISDWSSDVCSSDLHRKTGEEKKTSHCAAGSSIVPSPGLPVSAGGDAPGPPERLMKEPMSPIMSTDPCVSKIMSPSLSGVGEPPGSSTMKVRSEEHTSELQSLMRISYAVFCLKKKNTLRPKDNT